MTTKNTKDKTATLFVAFIIPALIAVIFFLFFTKAGRDFMNNRPYLSRLLNSNSPIPPKAPPHYFAEGVTEKVNAKGEKVIDSVYHVIPNFKFQTQNGDSLELDSLRGNLYVADFFFATCPGICPKLSNSLERVQTAFIKDYNFKIVSFTVDPDKDSVPALNKYAQLHDAIPGKWYYLRGPKENVYKLAREGFYITAKPDEDGGPEAFIHSEKLVLVDYNGNIRGYYSGIDSIEVNRMLADAVLLMRETESHFSIFKK